MATQKRTAEAETTEAVSTSKGAAGPADEGTADKAASSPPKQNDQPLYKAIARLQGALVADGEQLFIITDGDQAALPVTGVLKGKLTLRLIALPVEDRKGFFGFWPRADGSVVIASFNPPEHYTQNPDGPQVDEMLLSGDIEKTYDDAFTVKIRRNRGGHGRGSRKFRGTIFTVPSPPPDDYQPGKWVDLKLKRAGTKWVLSEGSAS